MPEEENATKQIYLHKLCTLKRLGYSIKDMTVNNKVEEIKAEVNRIRDIIAQSQMLKQTKLVDESKDTTVCDIQRRMPKMASAYLSYIRDTSLDKKEIVETVCVPNLSKEDAIMFDEKFVEVNVQICTEKEDSKEEITDVPIKSIQINTTERNTKLSDIATNEVERNKPKEETIVQQEERTDVVDATYTIKPVENPKEEKSISHKIETIGIPTKKTEGYKQKRGKVSQRNIELAEIPSKRSKLPIPIKPKKQPIDEVAEEHELKSEQ